MRTLISSGALFKMKIRYQIAFQYGTKTETSYEVWNLNLAAAIRFASDAGECKEETKGAGVCKLRLMEWEYGQSNCDLIVKLKPMSGIYFASHACGWQENTVRRWERTTLNVMRVSAVVGWGEWCTRESCRCRSGNRLLSTEGKTSSSTN